MTRRLAVQAIANGGSPPPPSGALWVADGGSSGFVYGDSRTTTIRVLAPTVPPTLTASIDISPYAAPSPFATSVRMLRMSADGNHVLACVKTAPPSYGGTPRPWAPGSVLFINKTTYAVEGIAVLSNTPAGFNTTNGARDCVDTGDGNLWVINSTGGNTSNQLETFDIATVLANGPGTPTVSFQQLVVPEHAEELCFGAGFIWTTGANYSQFISRIDPTSNTIATYHTGLFLYGCTFLFGAVWGAASNKVYRFDPARFFETFLTDTVTPPTPLGGVADFYNGFATDGTHVWVTPAFATGIGGSNEAMYWWELSTTGGSVAVLNTVSDSGSQVAGYGDGSQSAGTFDGTNLWFVRWNIESTGSPTNYPGIAAVDPVAGTLVVPTFSGPGTGYWNGPRSILFVS